MDAKSALLSILDGPWPVLTPADLDSLIERFFQAFQPANVDARRLLIAMAMNESSGGKNCLPRHEPAYCTGAYSKAPQVVHLTGLYGHNAHCSFGPWQILLVNCPDGTNPEDLHEADACARVTADFMARLNVHKKPQSVAEWGQIWNGGHIGADNPGVRAYVAHLQQNYDKAR
jgi:hypothetical protein